MEPELAEDGCNWHTYGSWVLKAISEEGLMGHLDGSETRPATPKLLQEYGAGQTPRTNEERDVVTAWKTADNTWHQRAAMAHQYIIFGLPDSILMLCMHLDTPHETFAYLENRYGQIPRPESQKVVDEATQEHDMPSKQYVIEESAQSAGDSNDKPGKSPSDAGSSPMSSSDCAEIPTGHQEPKMEIIDVRHVESNILKNETGAAVEGRLEEYANAPEAPDNSQCILDGETAARGDEHSAVADIHDALTSIGTSARVPDLSESDGRAIIPATGSINPENAQIADSDNELEILPSNQEHSPIDINDCVEIMTGQLYPKTEITGNDTVEYRSLPGGQGDQPDTTSKHAETKTGHTKPKTEVVDVRQVVDILSKAEVGTADPEQLDERMNVLKVPDERSQHTDDDFAQCRNLPEWSAEALEPADDPTRHSYGCSIEFALKMHLEQDQSVPTSGETILEIPDPPSDARIERPILQDKPSIRIHSPTRAEPKLPSGAAGATQPDECMHEPKALDTQSQCIEDKVPRRDEPDAPDEGSQHMVTARRHSPGWSAEALEHVSGHSIKSVAQGSAECNKHVNLKGNTIANVPDPPVMHAELQIPFAECSTLQDERSGKVQSCNKPETGSERENDERAKLKRHGTPVILHVLPREAGRWSDSKNGDATSNSAICSRGAEKKLLADSGSQHGGHEAKRQDGSPAPPEPPPKGILNLPRPFRVPRRRGRVKTNTERITGTRTRRDAYHAHVAPKWSLPPLFAPSKRPLDPAGGSWMMNVRYDRVRHARRIETKGPAYQIACILMRLLQPFSTSSKRLRHPTGGLWIRKIGCNEVRSARGVETRGHTYWIAGMPMRLLQTLSNVSKRIWNIANTHWRQGVHTGSTLNDAKRPKNLHIAKRLPPSSDMRRDNEHKAKWPNGSPAPSNLAQYDLSHPPRILRNSRRHSRIKTRSKNVSIVCTRPSAYHTPVVAIWPLQLVSKPTKRSRVIFGVSCIIGIRYNEVSNAGNAQTRGHAHHGDHTDGNPTISPSRALTKRWEPPWYVAGTYWMQGVSNEIKTSTENISDAHTRRYTKYRTKQPNGLPASPISPPRHLSKHLWNVANTYWRQGVPPGQVKRQRSSYIQNGGPRDHGTR
ncbi:hypothetical protein EDC04DRAFT_3149382 [Pisolithus marmoratus]|nr:hypothetical protein EDC04DRAFT_3149382 [Pisolithus marmoratus]